MKINEVTAAYLLHLEMPDFRKGKEAYRWYPDRFLRRHYYGCPEGNKNTMERGTFIGV